MSQGNYSEEIKEHILSEHEAGVSVRELARRYEPSATTAGHFGFLRRMPTVLVDSVAGSTAESRFHSGFFNRMS